MTRAALAVSLLISAQAGALRPPAANLSGLAVSNDSALVAVCATSGTPPQSTLFVADVATSAIVLEKPLAAAATAVAFSPDKSELAVALTNQPGKVLRFRVPGGEALPAAPDFPGIAGYAVYSPDGSQLAVAGTDAIFMPVFGKPSPPPSATLQVWSVREQRLSFGAPLGSLINARFAPDGSTLLVVRQKGGLAVVDGKTGALLHDVTSPQSPEVAGYFGGGVIGTFSPTRISTIRGGKSSPVPAQIDARINTLRLSADGSVAWAAGNDGVVRAFEVESGDEVHTVAPWLSREAELVPQTPGGAVAMAFSGDSQRLVAATGAARVDLWDVRGGRLVRRVGLEGRSIRAVGYKPDGSEIALGTSIGQLPYFDPSNGAAKGVDGQRTEQPITSIAYSLDGRRMAYASAEGRTRLHVTKPGEWAPARHVLENGGEAVLQVAFVTDGKVLATRDAKVVKLWNGDTGEALRTLPGDAPLSLCAGGRGVMVGSKEKLVYYEADTGTPHEMVGRGADIKACAIDPKGERVVVAQGYNAYLWPVVKGQPTVELKEVGYPEQIAFSPDGALFAVSQSNSGDRAILLYDRDGKLLRKLSSRVRPAQAVAFQRDGPLLAAIGDDFIARVWDLSHGRLVKTLRFTESRLPPSRIALSADGRLLAVGSASGHIELRDLATEHVFVEMEAEDQPITAMRFDEQRGRFLAASGATVHSYSFATNQGYSQPFVSFVSGEAAFDFLSDERVVVGVRTHFTDDETSSVAMGKWERVKGDLINTYRGQPPNRLIVAAPDGRFAIASWDDLAKKQRPTLWQLAEQRELEDQGKSNRADLLSREGKRIAVVRYRKETGDTATKGYRVLSDAVNALAFSPDSQVLAAGFGDEIGGEDNSIRFNDTSTGTLGKRVAQDAAVRGLAWRADGKMLAAALADGTVRLLTPEGDAIASLLTVGKEDWAIALPNGRYAASRNAARELSFRVGNRALPFDQLDLLLHRPDSVVEALSRGWKWTPASRIDAYAKQRQARLARTGFTESQLGQSYELPQVRIDRKALPAKTSERSITVSINAFSSARPLARLQISVNDVPALGRTGLALEGQPRRVKKQQALELSAGKNVIQVSAFDDAGSESLRETVEVQLEVESKPVLYLVSVGLSKYKEPGRDLVYPVADAEGLAKFFQANKGRFARVETALITDDQATREGILAARKLLAKAGPDDTAIVLLAGHGLRDSKDQFYFATHDVSFEKPEERGLAYSDIDSFFDDSRARRRLLLMDACYSGELDAPAAAPAVIAEATSQEATGIKLRGVTLAKSRASAERASSALEALYADLRRGSGAVVIAAAAGVEQAAERSELAHGVFTYSLLEGMTAATADSNKDGEVQISELRDYVVRRVRALSAGAQTPTVNRDNLAVDYGVAWK